MHWCTNRLIISRFVVFIVFFCDHSEWTIKQSVVVITYPTKIASSKQQNARKMNGAAWPMYWKRNPPSGGATNEPKEIKAKDIPNAR